MLRCSERSEVCYCGRSKFSVGTTEVTPVTDSSIDLLGKDCDDLQEDIAVADGAVTGSLKYVTGYTGWSGNPAEQEGNYLALKFENSTADEIWVGLDPSTHPEKPMTKLDPDGICIFRVTDNENQILKVDVITSGVHDGFSLDLSDLVCASANG